MDLQRDEAFVWKQILTDSSSVVNCNIILLRLSVSKDCLRPAEMSNNHPSHSSFKLGGRFCAIGMTVVLLEEFISQRVLKHTLFGWIIPTLLAFIPFLIASASVHKALRKKISRRNRLELLYYMIAGGTGLTIEWFLIGLSPWTGASGTDPILMTAFQLGMFSFWGSVAFVPRIMIDKRTVVVGLVKWLKRFLATGFAIIYFVTFGSARQSQFAAGIISILIFFLVLNAFYYRYIRSWRSDAPAMRTLA